MRDEPSAHLDPRLLQAFLDGEASPEEARRAREHLSVCPACREEAEAWANLFEQLGALPTFSADPAFVDRVMARVEMDHPTADALQDLLDGALPLAEESRILRHLQGCEGCASEVAAWSGLFARLDGLPDLDPAPEFGERVLDAVLPREEASWVARLASRWGLAPRDVRLEHLGPERIQDFLDGLLPRPVAARVERHLNQCPTCAGEVDQWAAFMASMDLIPHLEPGPEFQARVLGALGESTAVAPAATPDAAPAFQGPAIPVETGSRWVLPGWVRQWIPGSLGPRRALAAVSALALAPAGVLTAGLLYLFTLPQVTPGSLLVFAWWKIADAVAALGAGALEFLGGTPLLARALAAAMGLAEFPAALAGGALAFSAGTLIALWVLHRNLQVAPVRRGYHA